MRPICSTLALLLLAPAIAWADPKSAKLEEILAQWEKATADMNSMTTRCSRTEINKALRTVENYTGEIKLLKSKKVNEPWRGSLFLEKDGRPGVFEKLIWTGTKVYLFSPAGKRIFLADQRTWKRSETQKPVNWLERFEHDITSFLCLNRWTDYLFLDIRAKDAKMRYEITMIPDTNKWYHYLRILPRTEQDKAEFVEARVALNAKTHLVRQVWFLQANGNEVTWDFPQMTPNAALQAEDFKPPAIPPGWELERLVPAGRPSSP